MTSEERAVFAEHVAELRTALAAAERAGLPRAGIERARRKLDRGALTLTQVRALTRKTWAMLDQAESSTPDTDGP